VDAGEVNGRVFINNSSIGLYPEIVRRREKEQQAFNTGKWSAFAKACVSVLRRYRFLRVRIRVPGREFSRTTPFVFVGNNSYNLDGFGIGGREAINRGELCFWLARRTRPLGLIRLGLRALFGLLRGVRDFEAFCGPEFEVAPAQKKIRVALDGEITMMETPLRYRSRPRALRVMVPAGERSV
jgi:diacylglycerol kinase family enzyme